MATMNIFGIDCNVVFLDPTASGSNDGSTQANALTAMPLQSEYVSDTVYLMRRTASQLSYGDNTSSSPSNNSTASNVFFIGMPLTTDDLYNKLPPSLQGTSWDSDGETHAKIYFSTGIAKIILSGCESFGMHRIQITKNSNDDDSESSNTQANLTIYGGGRKGHGFFTQCEVYELGHDFSDVGYDGSSNPNFHGFSIYFGDFNNFDHKNNKHVNVSDYNSTSTQAFLYFHNIANLYSENNELWGLTSRASATAVHTQFYADNNCYFVSYKNNTHKFCGSGGEDDQSPPEVIIRSLHYDIRNVSFTFDRQFYGSSLSTSTNYGIHSLLHVEWNNNNYYQAQGPHIVDGVFVDMTGSGWKITSRGTAVVYISAYISGNPQQGADHGYVGAESYVNNIQVNTDTNSNAVDGKSVVSVDGPVRVSNITTNTNYSTSENLWAQQYAYCQEVCGVTCRGGLLLQACGYVDVDDIYYEKSGGGRTGVIDCRSSFLRARNVHLDPTWEAENWLETSQLISNVSNESRIIIDNVNKNVFADLDGTSNNADNQNGAHFGVWVNNVNGVTNNKVIKFTNFDMKLWGTKRTAGSSQVSFRFEGLTGYDHRPLTISPTTLRGVEFSPGAVSGSISFYFAFLNNLLFDSNGYSKYFKIEVEGKVLAFNGEMSEQTFDSVADGIWEDQSASDWDEPNLIAKKLTIPFQTDNVADVLKVRIYFNWYEPNSYFYLDPSFEVTV